MTHLIMKGVENVFSQNDPFSLQDHWWDLGASERENWKIIHLDQDPAYDEHDYIPMEFALVVAYVMFKVMELPYVSATEAVRNQGMIASEEYLKQLCEGIVNGDEAVLSFGILEDIDPYKISETKTPFKSRANARILAHERQYGVSGFTEHCKAVLESGFADYRAICWMANEIFEFEKEVLHFKLPQKPFQAERAAKVFTLPGYWELRKADWYHGYYGPNYYCICSDSQNNGVCFSVSVENFLTSGVVVGEMCDIRANVAEDGDTNSKGEKTNYLKLERVQLKPRGYFAQKEAEAKAKKEAEKAAKAEARAQAKAEKAIAKGKTDA